MQPGWIHSASELIFSSAFAVTAGLADGPNLHWRCETLRKGACNPLVKGSVKGPKCNVYLFASKTHYAKGCSISVSLMVTLPVWGGFKCPRVVPVEGRGAGQRHVAPLEASSILPAPAPRLPHNGAFADTEDVAGVAQGAVIIASGPRAELGLPLGLILGPSYKLMRTIATNS